MILNSLIPMINPPRFSSSNVPVLMVRNNLFFLSVFFFLRIRAAHIAGLAHSDGSDHGGWSLAQQHNVSYRPSLHSSKSRTSPPCKLLGCKTAPAARFPWESALTGIRCASTIRLTTSCVSILVAALPLAFKCLKHCSVVLLTPPVDHYLWFAGRCHRVARISAAGSKFAPLLHPPGPSRLYPKEHQAAEEFLAELEMELYQELEGSPETTGVIETPPEWGRPDEGNPNQPRRPPEYNPPQVCCARPCFIRIVGKAMVARRDLPCLCRSQSRGQARLPQSLTLRGGHVPAPQCHRMTL